MLLNQMHCAPLFQVYLALRSNGIYHKYYFRINIMTYKTQFVLKNVFFFFNAGWIEMIETTIILIIS